MIVSSGCVYENVLESIHARYRGDPSTEPEPRPYPYWAGGEVVLGSLRPDENAAHEAPRPARPVDLGASCFFGPRLLHRWVGRRAGIRSPQKLEERAER